MVVHSANLPLLYHVSKSVQRGKLNVLKVVLERTLVATLPQLAVSFIEETHIASIREAYGVEVHRISKGTLRVYIRGHHLTHILTPGWPKHAKGSRCYRSNLRVERTQSVGCAAPGDNSGPIVIISG